MANGNGYLGSSSLQVSESNQELIPNPPSHWSRGYKLMKFSFSNEQTCTVVVNEEVTLYLKSGQGFEVDKGDAPITSFVIKESGVSFNWIGMF